jgi:hypothetical protein
MKESVTYQAIVAEGVKKGRAEGVKKAGPRALARTCARYC